MIIDEAYKILVSSLRNFNCRVEKDTYLNRITVHMTEHDIRYLTYEQWSSPNRLESIISIIRRAFYDFKMDQGELDSYEAELLTQFNEEIALELQIDRIQTEISELMEVIRACTNPEQRLIKNVRERTITLKELESDLRELKLNKEESL